MSYEMSGIGDDTVRRVINPIRESRGWMKFLAVLSIAYGVLAAITIIGLIIAWLPIWMGVLLYQSADKADNAYQAGNEGDAVESLSKLKTIFVVYGIMAIIGLVLTVLYLIAIIALIASGDFSDLSLGVIAR